MKKYLVLGILFIFPIVVYLFFASGINNFAKLPILQKNIEEISEWETLSGKNVQLENSISIIGFWGNDLDFRKLDAFNLNQKIYKRFYKFKDLQFLMVVLNSNQDKLLKIIDELKKGSSEDMSKWKFILGDETKIKKLFSSFGSDIKLNTKLSTPFVFIVDKDRNLRGRDDDDDLGTLYAYNSSSVAELTKKMTDDIKIILAEYRLALKKNNKYKLDREI
ncbi:MAG: hypothetical protein EVA36_05360 [Flavobacteriales bacterium]|nr:hypothetical protein [Flavobacteriaceae bacterium]RZP10745.1 MAG: hypothetical protein EVA36_05360 [Flavobacteriales bacterium]